MIDVTKVKSLITKASKVIIMSHKNLDLDALGSSLGMYYLSLYFKKDVYLLIEKEKFEKGVSRSLKRLKVKGINVNIKSFNELKSIIDQRTLLIIVDVHIPHLTQNKKILAMVNNLMVIDHHVVDKDIISNINYEYINEATSSASEIVAHLIKKLKIPIPSYIATVMLAGIIVDTNSFSIKTSYITHKIASFLHFLINGSMELPYLLKEDLNRYLKRQSLINNLEIINQRIAIAASKNNDIYYKEDLAKVAGTILRFDEIECSFTIAKIEASRVGISARSLGNVNVQKVMECIGGGGHITDAATQLKNVSVKETKKRLLASIEEMGSEI